ncbi:MAG: YdcH family protein [Geminicoccaceae bacterium]
MSVQEHVDSLRNKHAHLEHLIDEELHRPMPDQSTVVRMKKEKLRIKEEIERLRHAPEVRGLTPAHA